MSLVQTHSNNSPLPGLWMSAPQEKHRQYPKLREMGILKIPLNSDLGQGILGVIYSFIFESPW